LKFSRLSKYYYLRFLRLRGEPHELALGAAFGVFSGMMPIMPFHMVLAVTLAIAFKGSKLTAALGSWISNPLNWYLIYSLDYKIGFFILNISREDRGFLSFMESIRSAGEGLAMIKEIISSGGIIIAAFISGGLILGIIVSIPSYFICLTIFKYIKSWREGRGEKSL
jgi:uncharacterized protein (DUF2062 family)